MSTSSDCAITHCDLAQAHTWPATVFVDILSIARVYSRSLP